MEQNPKGKGKFHCILARDIILNDLNVSFSKGHEVFAIFENEDGDGRARIPGGPIFDIGREELFLMTDD